MNKEELKLIWKNEEDCAHINGWDFSHIHNRYCEEENLSWNYEETIHKYLKDDMKILDYGEHIYHENRSFSWACPGS